MEKPRFKRQNSSPEPVSADHAATSEENLEAPFHPGLHGSPESGQFPMNPPRNPQALLKIARILDQENGAFGLEYDNTLGKKHFMRLDASTYEKAVREAKSFLEIDGDNRDADGNQWDIE